MKQDYTKGYLPGLDGIRGIAVLLVVIYHMDLLPFLRGGFIGVDIFFVLSGYVISRSIYNRKCEKFFPYLTEFYKRRILRIAPALCVCILTTILTAVLFIPDTVHTTGIAAFFGYSNFSLIQNSGGYFSTRVNFDPFLHTWSLAVEEQFYLLFPILFFGWIRFRNRQSPKGYIYKIILPLFALGSIVCAFVETRVHHDRAFYLLHSRFWELAAGALLFQLHANGKAIPGKTSTKNILIILGLILLLPGVLYSDPGAFPYPWAFLPVCTSLLFISALLTPSSELHSLGKLFAWKPLVYSGNISYSWYLWHWPIAVLLRWTVGFNSWQAKGIYLFLSITLAILSYRYIETPVRKNKALMELKEWKVLSAGLVSIGIFLSLSLLSIHVKESISLSVTKDRYIWHPGLHWQDRLNTTPAMIPGISGRRIFSLGDSHTAFYRTMLHIVSQELTIEWHEYEAGGCAVAGLLKPMEKLEGSLEFYQNSLEDIRKKSQPGDIVFLASLRMPELSDRFELVDIPAVLKEFNNYDSRKDRAAALIEADRIITELESLGLIVLFEAPLPVVKIPPYRCSDWFNRTNPIASPGTTIDRDFLKEVRSPVMSSIGELQHRHQKLEVWDPFPVLCTSKKFSCYDEKGLPLFYDGDHLSAQGNRILVPSFRETLIEIWKNNDKN